jgi:hypothetical protein
MATPVVPPALDRAIRRHIDGVSLHGLTALLGPDWPMTGRGHPLFIKFASAKFGGAYGRAVPPAGLFISATPGYTWGRACYVTPLLYPLSTAIFGRCGVVAEADPTDWRLFDATSPAAQDLYMDWVRVQPFSRLLMLTTHSQLANQYLRDRFRTQYRIDCVIFPPDEIGRHYTRRKIDRWLAVSEWGPGGELAAAQFCTRFRGARLGAVLAEEFETVHKAVGRRSLIGPHHLPIDHAAIRSAIAAAYATNQIATISA